jgi:hypothetical protein
MRLSKEGFSGLVSATLLIIGTPTVGQIDADAEVALKRRRRCCAFLHTHPGLKGHARRNP